VIVTDFWDRISSQRVPRRHVTSGPTETLAPLLLWAASAK